MKAVARLMLTYFTGTRLLSIVTGVGLLGVVGGTARAALLTAARRAERYAVAFVARGRKRALQMLPVAGLLCFVFGASLLPSMFMRLATSHYAYVLPYGRAKLLGSAFATVALVALVASATVASSM